MNLKKLFGIALAAMLLLPVMPTQAAVSEKTFKQAWAIGRVVGGVAIALMAACAIGYFECHTRTKINGQMQFPDVIVSDSMTNADVSRLDRVVVRWFHGGLGLLVAGGLTLAGYGIKALLKK